MNDTDRERIKAIGAQLDGLRRSLSLMNKHYADVRKGIRALEEDYFDFVVKYSGDIDVEEVRPETNAKEIKQEPRSIRSCQAKARSRDNGRFLPGVRPDGDSAAVQ